jgi:hypothetical protein
MRATPAMLLKYSGKHVLRTNIMPQKHELNESILILNNDSYKTLSQALQICDKVIVVLDNINDTNFEVRDALFKVFGNDSINLDMWCGIVE